MANVMRKRWDARANPDSVLEFAVASGTAIEIGDLCWLDSSDNTVKPASSTALWTGTLAGTRAKLAEKFVGVARSAHVANDASVATVRVSARGVFVFPVGSAAVFEIGDHVIGSRDGSNNYLKAQQVEKMTGTSPISDPNDTMAIGRVARREPVAASQVTFEIASRAVAGGGVRAFLAS